MDYPKLSSPLTIKNTTFRNRIVFPPVQTNYAAPNGETTERHINFYENIAKNNVGLTIVGATGISPYSRLGDHAFCLYDDQHVQSGKALFEAIGRGLIADPELVTKTIEGSLEEIVECTVCMQCFMPSEGPGMTCAVNEKI